MTVPNYENYQFTASERFLRYVTIDTQSDSSSDSSPSTEKQKNLLDDRPNQLRQRQRLAKNYVYTTFTFISWTIYFFN